MRYVIKFSKESSIKFISHLDLMRTIQRVIRRAELPIEYSRGFNPHMGLSIAQPLSVGVYSLGEYMDVVLTEDIESDVVIRRLKESCPSGVKILDVKKIQVEGTEKKSPQTMALIEAAHYEIKIPYNDSKTLKAELESLLNQGEWIALKKRKDVEKLINIKTMIKDFAFEVTDGMLVLSTIISCGSKENLSPELLSRYIKENTTGAKEDAFIDVKRIELYTYVDNKLTSLIEYFKYNVK